MGRRTPTDVTLEWLLVRASGRSSLHTKENVEVCDWLEEVLENKN